MKQNRTSIKIIILSIITILLFTACTIESSYIDLIREELGLSNELGRFIAVGDSGTVFYSDDGGVNWTAAESTPPGSPNLNRVRYVNDRLVAVGDGGTLWYSTDGTNWTAVSTGTIYDLKAVAYGATVYVVVGEDGSNSGVTLTSTDGVNWNGPVTLAGFRFQGLTFGGLSFFAICGGATWTTQSGAAADVLNGTWTAGGYSSGNGRGFYTDYGTNNFVIIYTDSSNPIGRYSSLGTTGSWTDGHSIGGVIIPRTLRNNSTGRLASVGNGGTVWYTDDDGDNWIYRPGTAGWGDNAEDVVYGDNRWVAVGLTGGVWFSTDSDLITWTAASNPPGFEHLHGVAYIP